MVGLPVALDALGSGGAAFPAPYEIINYQVAEGGKIPMAIDCWLDFFDMLSEGVLMPFGALAMSVLIGWVYKTKNAVVTECEQAGRKFWATASSTSASSSSSPSSWPSCSTARSATSFNR